MSSTTAADPPPGRPWSLAARLTAYYAASAFALVLLATGYLYWAMVTNVDREDDQLLADRVQAALSRQQARPGDPAALGPEERDDAAAGRPTHVFLRIVGGDGRTLAESPGMAALLPAESLPAPAAEPGAGADVRAAGRL